MLKDAASKLFDVIIPLGTVLFLAIATCSFLALVDAFFGKLFDFCKCPAFFVDSQVVGNEGT